MNKKKTIILMIAALLIVAAGVGTTLAYFTDKDTASNTFTMGHVDIDLTEESTDAAITADGLDFDNIVPGGDYEKIPTITVQNGSSNCYIRVKMTVDISNSTITADDIAALETSLGAQITANGFEKLGDYYYFVGTKTNAKGVLAAGEAVDFFESVEIPAVWGNNTADQDFSIVLLAEAIQADNFSQFDENGVLVGWSDTVIKAYTA